MASQRIDSIVGRDEILVHCPGCGARLTLGRVSFPGMPILVEADCAGCGESFLLDWPAGHALLHPVAVDRRTGATYHAGSPWYARALRRVLDSRERPEQAPIEARVRPPAAADAVLVNCIDFLYGHSLLKLLSLPALLRERPELDVLAVVPRNLVWLVPAGVRSLIQVDLPQERSGRWIEGLDETVQELLASYDSVLIGSAISQPALAAADLAQLRPSLRAQPFWDEDAGTAPQVTFVLREDRLWASPGRLPALLDRRFLRRAARRLLVGVQQRRVASVARHLRREAPGARLVAIGLGRSGGLPAAIEDLRRESIDEAGELLWCAEYGRSRVVVGVHGSHMLLPSALAGATVELVPPAKLANVTQDLVIAGEAEHEPKLALFRYRLLPLGTRPRALAEIVVSILRDARFHHFNVVENRGARPGHGWAQPIDWKRLG